MDYISIQIVVHPLDLLDFATKDGYNDEFVESLMQSIPFADIDILVMNSGMIQYGYAVDNHIDILQRISLINTIGPVSLIQSIIRYWHKHDKLNKDTLHQISVTSSIAGKLGSPRQSAYAMSKFAINGYLETLQMELIDDYIDINIFNPGHVELNEQSLDATSTSLKEDKLKRGLLSKGKGRMTLQRCAHLYVTVLEYSISDSIVSIQPVLLFTYIKQYLPAFYHPLTRLVLPIFDEHYKKPKQ